MRYVVGTAVVVLLVALVVSGLPQIDIELPIVDLGYARYQASVRSIDALYNTLSSMLKVLKGRRQQELQFLQHTLWGTPGWQSPICRSGGGATD